MAEMRFSKVFWKIYDACKVHPRYIVNVGGTRSTKTYSSLQFLHLLIPKADKSGDITSVVSESIPHLKRGAIRDFERILGHPLDTDPNWNATDFVYKYSNGAKLEFFSSDSPGKVHGPARKRFLLNEGNHIPYEVFRQLEVRTTGLIMIDYNPAASCWIDKKIEPRDNCVRIHSTYLDNPFLTQEQIDSIEAQKQDKNWWRVYGQGLTGSLEGVIYEFEQIDHLPPKGLNKPQYEKTEEELYADSLTEIHGLDFGFTNDPTARVQVLADTKRKHLFVRQRCYKTRMMNSDIVNDLRMDGVTNMTEIFADCAEPKSIAEIKQGGFRIVPCDKDAPVKSDKLKFQLQWMQGWKLFVTKDSLDLIEELRNYTWARDNDGNWLNYPIDKFNHLLDALRYAVWSKFGLNVNKGKYSISCR